MLMADGNEYVGSPRSPSEVCGATRGAETLVVWMSEHGRTPKFNREAGRDHWSRVYSMAGGGVARGRVVGSSDDMGGDVKDTPVSPKDILPTILHLLGIDAHTIVHDQFGRPMPVVGTGYVRSKIF